MPPGRAEELPRKHPNSRYCKTFQTPFQSILEGKGHAGVEEPEILLAGAPGLLCEDFAIWNSRRASSADERRILEI